MRRSILILCAALQAASRADAPATFLTERLSWVALATPAFVGFHPFGTRDRRLKSDLCEDLGELVQERSKVQPAAIASGYTALDLDRWQQSLQSNPDHQIGMMVTYGSHLAGAALAMQKAAVETASLVSKVSFPRPYGRYKTRIQQAIRKSGATWFTASVDSPWMYILGAPSLFALDVVEFLGEVEKGSVVRSPDGDLLLRDKKGQPYTNLLNEYFLHEILETTTLTHDEIVELTTRVFRRGYYRRSGSVAVTVKWHEETYDRPGQTPLGRALRFFINFRFRKKIEHLLSRRIEVNFFGSQHQTVQMAQGMARRLLPGPTLELVVHSVKTYIPLADIVSVAASGGNASFPLLKYREISEQLPFPIYLTYENLRTVTPDDLSDPEPLRMVFRALLEARDRAGRHLFMGVRPYAVDPSETLSWLNPIIEILRGLNLRLILGDIFLNAAGAACTVVPNVFIPGFEALPENDKSMRLVADRISSALLQNTIIGLGPSKIPPVREMRLAA